MTVLTMVADRLREAVEGISRPGCALAWWRRGLPAELAEALTGVEPDGIDDVEAVVPIVDADLHLAFRLGAAGYPERTVPALVRDMAMLVGRHAVLRGESSARVRLEWVETDACRRFHSDMTTTRLLTTYVGGGTQWRLADGLDGEARSAATGDVLILKGRALMEDAPVLHRSPPIADAGGRRLLLVVDAAGFGR